MQQEILELIESKKFARLREMLVDINPADIASFLAEVELKELPVVFRILPKELAADVFVEMDTDMQQVLIESFNDKELREVMDELFMDDTVFSTSERLYIYCRVFSLKLWSPISN